MKTIYKYPLKVTDTQQLKLPVGSKVLDIQVQKSGLFKTDELCLWVLLNPDEPLTNILTIQIVGTGNPADQVHANDYFKTVQQFDGGLVWHIFLSKELGDEESYV